MPIKKGQTAMKPIPLRAPLMILTTPSVSTKNEHNIAKAMIMTVYRGTTQNCDKKAAELLPLLSALNLGVPAFPSMLLMSSEVSPVARKFWDRDGSTNLRYLPK